MQRAPNVYTEPKRYLTSPTLTTAAIYRYVPPLGKVQAFPPDRSIDPVPGRSTTLSSRRRLSLEAQDAWVLPRAHSRTSLDSLDASTDGGFTCHDLGGYVQYRGRGCRYRVFVGFDRPWTTRCSNRTRFQASFAAQPTPRRRSAIYIVHPSGKPTNAVHSTLETRHSPDRLLAKPGYRALVTGRLLGLSRYICFPLTGSSGLRAIRHLQTGFSRVS